MTRKRNKNHPPHPKNHESSILNQISQCPHPQNYNPLLPEMRQKVTTSTTLSITQNFQ